jgi:alkylation response protein AidB-like acyl-CoA dehydrogenase
VTGIDFGLSASQQEFEESVRAFLTAEVPTAELEEPVALLNEHSVPIYAKLAGRGWLGMNIPSQYGGQGRGAVELAIFRDWTSYARAPLGGFTSASRIGHALHLTGSEEQRERFLPGLVRGELLFSIGYTEPGSGSDLASLSTRALRDGDNFVVNGQKIFTTAGHLADYVFLACRTDPSSPRHRGISVLMVDLHSPGVHIDPIWTLGGWRLNTLYFDDVLVPAENLVGELNGGWRVVATALDVERTGIQPAGQARRLVDDLWRIHREEPQRLIVDPGTAKREIGDIEAEVTAARWFAYRQAWLQDQGRLSADQSAASKLLGSRAFQRAAAKAVELLGSAVFVNGGPHASGFEREYRYAPQASIAAGTSEIMSNIIAKHGLGLSSAS